MKRTFRRLAGGIAGAVLILVVIWTIETYTANRRFEEFIRRTGQIHDGATETDVLAVAGPPNKLLTDLGSTDSLSIGASCRKANGAAAMLYDFEYHGWVGERLGLRSSIYTEVMCLDKGGIVVKRYSEMIFFER